MKNKWLVRYAVRTGIGRVRKNNEDAFYANGIFLPLAEMDQDCIRYDRTTLDGTLFAVCDGMGGHQSGEVASFMAVSKMNNLAESLNGRNF